MTLPELAAMLEAIPGFSGKVTYHSFPAGDAPALPFIVYLADASDNFAADNMVYHGQQTVDIELYTKRKDPEAEAALEAALNAVPLYWERVETYIETEQCFQNVYTVTI